VTLRISVAVARPGLQRVVALELPEGSRVADALAQRAVRALFAGQDPAQCPVGIWSRRCTLETPLCEGDRVELYRALEADAKALRRARMRPKPSTRSRSES